MIDERMTTWRYLGIFLLGCFLLSHPVMTIFNISILIFGIPLLFLYIFVSWLLVIFLIRQVSQKFFTPEAPQPSSKVQSPGREE